MSDKLPGGASDLASVARFVELKVGRGTHPTLRRMEHG